MTKTKGFKLRIEAFLPIDKKDFNKQAAAFATLAEIERTGKLPAGFFDQVTILGIDAKEGSAELPAPDYINDPATVPLTTDPLAEGAAVLEATTALDGSIFQTVRLVDGTEVFRRISAEQDAAEQAAAGGKRGRKPAAE